MYALDLIIDKQRPFMISEIKLLTSYNYFVGEALFQSVSCRTFVLLCFAPGCLLILVQEITFDVNVCYTKSEGVHTYCVYGA